MDSVRVFVGGIIPNQDIPELKQLGVSRRVPARGVDPGRDPGHRTGRGRARLIGLIPANSLTGGREGSILGRIAPAPREAGAQGSGVRG